MKDKYYCGKYYCGKCKHIGIYTGRCAHSEKICKLYAEILKVDDNGVEKCVPCVCKTLETENVALRERLKKAVELPRVEYTITKEWVNRETIGDRMFEWCVLYKKDGYLMVEPCLSKEAAEARLKELQGGKK